VKATRSVDRRQDAALHGSTDLQPADPASAIEFSVLLRLPHRQALARYARAINDPRSTSYRQPLDVVTLGRRFGLSKGEIEQVVRRLRSAGLDTIAIYPQRTALRVRGTVADVDSFFDVSVRAGVDNFGRRVRLPSTLPLIPADLRRSVVGVTGIATQTLARRPAAVPASGLKPRDVARAYDVDRLWHAGLHGEHQTVAVVSYDVFRRKDVSEFDRVTHTSGPAVERIAIGGGANPHDSEDATLKEVATDIDVLRAVAPKAQILDYEASAETGLDEVIRTIVADHRTDIVSISWGTCEDSEDPNVKPTERELEVAAAVGVNVFVASGDAGAYDCGTRDLAVDWPSSSPSVIAVGGTRLSVRRDGSYLDEVGWEDVLSGQGGGGGVSRIFARPTWQRAAGIDAGSEGRRRVPDVSAAADCDSAFFVVYTGDDKRRRYGPAGCGTSAAAPFWAGTLVLISQLAEQRRLGRMLAFGPLLYELATTAPTSFHDVVRGGNRYYDAGPGWDYATGLGSPNVFELARSVVRYLERHR
jgi:kumamolisin